jgi:hypothetical protein
MIKYLIFYGISATAPLLAQRSPFDPPSEKTAPDAKDSNTNLDIYGDLYCDPKKGLFNAPILRSAGEASLYRGTSSSAISLRLAISPVREKPIVLRMYQRGDSYYISLRRLSGRGGYELGHLELSGEISISKQDFIEVVSMADRESILDLSKMTLQQRNDTLMMDSSCWSLEYLKNNNYQVIDLYSADRYAEGAIKLCPQLTKHAMEVFLDLTRRLFTLCDMSTKNYIQDK